MAYLILFIIGTIFGSFSNVVVNRKIKGRSIIYPPSHCETCGHKLGPSDLVPILSFIFLKGKCRYCKAKIPRDNLLMEISCGLISALLFNPSRIFQSVLLIPATFLGLIIAAIDLKTFDVYLNQTLILLILGILYRYLFIGFDKDFFIKVLIFILIYGLIFYLSKGGLGDGDIYYYLSLMTFIENDLIAWFILISIWVGAIYGSILAIKEKSTKIEIPFCIFIFIAFMSVEIFTRFSL